jgi:hypothetical protein
VGGDLGEWPRHTKYSFERMLKSIGRRWRPSKVDVVDQYNA